MRGACALLLLTACFSPNAQSNDRPDAGTSDGSGSAGGSFHVGTQLLRDTTLAATPTGAVALTTVVNTGATSTGNCTQIVGKLCIVAGATITIPSTATVRAIGPNALVLVAAESITIQGTLDASSRLNETLGGVAVYGAGARGAIDCNAVGVDGTAGTNFNGGGGAAGGSFGGMGAAGGVGRNNTARGNPVLGAAPTTFLGGCAGGHGGDGTDGGGGGVGGGGGGGVYLFAGTSINVSGKISASGAGGGPGANGMASSGGAGGGGSGGMIVLESPKITVAGALYANGGGGGGGGGDQGNGDAGSPGADVTAATTAASGGAGKNGGGKGGAGAFAATAAVEGTKANTNNSTECSGGGGGGGVGVIRMFGTSTTTGATISPAAT